MIRIFLDLHIIYQQIILACMSNKKNAWYLRVERDYTVGLPLAKVRYDLLVGRAQSSFQDWLLRSSR